MRLRVRVERNELPAVQVLWNIAPTETKNTISQFLERVNERFPLEGETWGLDDYSVMVAGYEATHYSEIGNTFKDEDEVVIKPLGYADLRTRTLTGRDQISEDGRHLLDGVPFGRPLLKRPRRPDVRIPPRKKQRMDDGQALAGVEEELMSEDEDDDEDDGDFDEDALPEMEDVSGSDEESDESSESSEEDSESSEDSDSSSDDSSDSESDSGESSEASWDGLEERDEQVSAGTAVVTDNAPPSRASLPNTAQDTTPQHIKLDPSRAGSDSPLPGQGKNITRERNARRRDAKQLKHMKRQGILPPTATLKNMYEYLGRTESINRDQMETERQRLLDQIAEGGVDVNETPATNGHVEDDDDEPPEEQPIRRPEEQAVRDPEDSNIEAAVAAETSQDNPTSEPPANPYVDDAEPAAPTTRRARLDLKGMNRMVFSSLGVRAPKTQADRDALQKKLAARPKKSMPIQATEAQTEDDAANDDDPEAWRKKVVLTAVECLDEGVELSAPDFPFQQRWDPQYQYSNKRAANGAKSKRNKKRRVSAQANGSHSDYIETYDKYNQDGGGDALNYGDPEDEDEEFDDSYWEEGALLDGGDEADADAETDDRFPKLPEDTTSLPSLKESDAKKGDFVVFEELSVSAATSWTPKTVTKLAQLDEKTEKGWNIIEAPTHPKVYDENGKRVYTKFEMEGLSDDGEDEGTRLVQWGELQGIRLLKRDDI